MSLSLKKIEKLKKRGRYFDERGLYLQIISEKNRSWIFRYEFGMKAAPAILKRHGKWVPSKRAGQMVANARFMGLGPFPDVSLDAAREPFPNYRNMGMFQIGLMPEARRTL